MQSNQQKFFKKILSFVLSMLKEDNNTKYFTLRLTQCDNCLLSFTVYRLLVLLFFFTSFTFGQIDELKWNKTQISYEKQIHHTKRNYSFEADNAGEFLTKSLANAYWFFISDVDGDNCPFRPTCSSFLIQSAKETNIFQASLMFYDRFTRDMNIIKGHNHYPRVSTGYYYDPPRNYTLSRKTIKYLPPEFIIDDE